MFTGIIEQIGEVVSLSRSEEGARLGVRAPMFELSAEAAQQQVGASYANSGVCLSAVQFADGAALFDLASETLRATALGQLRVGSRVNLERALPWGGRIDGHLVQGHVDAVARLCARQSEGNTERLEFSLPPSIAAMVAAKGSVAIDGVSLTVGEVGLESFSVYVIPHTLQCTTLGELTVGSLVNLEADVLARYVARALRAQGLGGK